jgi:hypothetical protein
MGLRRGGVERVGFHRPNPPPDQRCKATGGSSPNFVEDVQKKNRTACPERVGESRRVERARRQSLARACKGAQPGLSEAAPSGGVEWGRSARFQPGEKPAPKASLQARPRCSRSQGRESHNHSYKLQKTPLRTRPRLFSQRRDSAACQGTTLHLRKLRLRVRPRL